jgi:putative ABC transport system substrate-binding protein
VVSHALFFAALTLVAVATAADAQTEAKPKRIGYLTSSSPSSGFHDQFEKGMRELGWIPGRNIEIEYRFSAGDYERLPALADEFVRMKVDVIVAQPTAPSIAASKATRTIPIVMVNAGDPVGAGLVTSLSHPGGNVTGLAFAVGSDTFGKGLEILNEFVPDLKRVAVLSNPANPAQALAVANVRTSAQKLGMSIVAFEARSPDDFDRVFKAIATQRAQAMLVIAESLFILHRDALAALALRHRLPTMYGVRDNVVAGGLMSYGPNPSQTSRRAAAFVDRILKGAKPADLPVEQPTAFELVVNRTTARVLGITLPPSILGRADLIVE